MSKKKPLERPYETLFVVAADMPQKAIDDFSEKIKKILSETGGVMRSVQNWGRRRLTYAIKHNREGQFVYIDFNGTGQSAANITTLFRVSDFVLRHMIVERVDKAKEELKAAVGMAEVSGGVPQSGTKMEGEPKTDLGTVPPPEAAKLKEAPSAS